MKVSAVCVSVDYSDYLAHTILHAKAAFDNLVVVTSVQDFATQDLCEHYYVKCLATDAFFQDGQAFNKGAGINVGLSRLDPEGWWCHFDSDIVLPPRTHQLLENANLDPSMIYGIDRIMCRSYESWAAHLQQPEIQASCNSWVQATAFPLGTRVAAMGQGQDGWCPIGYFQLFSPSVSGHRTYPGHSDAGRGDMRFARLWPRAKRGLIPEIVGIHLEAELSQMAANWRGRRTPPFGPCPPPPKPRAPPCSEY